MLSLLHCRYLVRLSSRNFYRLSCFLPTKHTQLYSHFNKSFRFMSTHEQNKNQSNIPYNIFNNEFKHFDKTVRFITTNEQNKNRFNIPYNINQEEIKKQAEKAWTTIKAYKTGLTISLGVVTGIVIIIFFFRPQVKDGGSLIASDVLSSQQVYDQIFGLAKTLRTNILQDPQTLVLLTSLCVTVLQSEDIQQELIKLLGKVLANPETREMAKEFLIYIVSDPFIQNKLVELLVDTVLKLLENAKIINATEKFAIDVINREQLKEKVKEILLNACKQILAMPEFQSDVSDSFVGAFKKIFV